MEEQQVPATANPNHENGPIAFLGVNYEEFKPETYQSVFVTIKSNNEESNAIFSSGDFEADLLKAQTYLHGFEGRKYELSSLHHFLTDRKKG